MREGLYFNHVVRVNSRKFQDNSLIAIRDSVKDLVSGGVRMILTRPDKIVDGILNQFDFNGSDLDKKARKFLYTALGKIFDVIDYDQLADIVQDPSAAEDLNLSIKPCFRAGSQ